MNVIAAEMEASVILVLARIWGLRAGGIAVVLDNVLRVSGDVGRVRPAGAVRARRRRDRAARPHGLGDRPDRRRAGRGATERTPADVSPQYHVKLAPGRRRAVRAAARRSGAGPGRRLVLGRGPRGRAQPRVRDLHRDLPRSADLVHLDRDRGAVHGDRARGARAGGRDDVRADRDVRVAPGRGSRIGDVAIFDSAARYDGASRLYAPLEFPAVADHGVVTAAIEAARQPGRDAPRRDDVLDRRLLHAAGGGRVRRLPAVVGARGLRGRPAAERPGRRDGVERPHGPGADLGAPRRRDGGRRPTTCSRRWTRRGAFDAEATFDVGAAQMERLARVGSETVRVLAERDAARRTGLAERLAPHPHPVVLVERVEEPVLPRVDARRERARAHTGLRALAHLPVLLGDQVPELDHRLGLETLRGRRSPRAGTGTRRRPWCARDPSG